MARQQQSSARRRISPRKPFQFLIKTLEAQAEAKRSAIFHEELASLFNVFRKRGRNYLDRLAITTDWKWRMH